MVKTLCSTEGFLKAHFEKLLSTHLNDFRLAGSEPDDGLVCGGQVPGGAGVPQRQRDDRRHLRRADDLLALRRRSVGRQSGQFINII